MLTDKKFSITHSETPPKPIEGWSKEEITYKYKLGRFLWKSNLFKIWNKDYVSMYLLFNPEVIYMSIDGNHTWRTIYNK